MPITIAYTLEAWLHIRAAIQFNPKLEVGGWGKVTREGDRFVVTDVLVPPQIVNGSHTDISVERGDMNWLYGELTKRRENPAFADEQAADWKLWWHSHAGMPTNPSGTDHNTLMMLAGVLGGFALGTVFNAKDEATAWMAYTFDHPVTLQRVTREDTDLKVEVSEYRDTEIESRVAGWMAEVKEATPVAANFRQVPLEVVRQQGRQPRSAPRQTTGAPLGAMASGTGKASASTSTSSGKRRGSRVTPITKLSEHDRRYLFYLAGVARDHGVESLSTEELVFVSPYFEVDNGHVWLGTFNLGTVDHVSDGFLVQTSHRGWED